jgi:GxxExxY protein
MEILLHRFFHREGAKTLRVFIFFFAPLRLRGEKNLYRSQQIKAMEKQELERIATQVVDAGYRVHKELGPGLLESVYQLCLLDELDRRGIYAEMEVPLPLYYRGRRLNKEFRLDLLVEGEIIVEVKAVEVVIPVHVAQIISYLKLADLRLGFLMNFHVPVFKNGIHRYVNNL